MGVSYLLATLVVLIFAVVLGTIEFVSTSVCMFSEDSYKLPDADTTIRIHDSGLITRTKMVISDKSGPLLSVCLFGRARTRLQLYYAANGQVLVEGYKDAYIVSTNPIKIQGAQKRLDSSVGQDCWTDGYVYEINELERSSLKQGTDWTYVGAFDQKSSKSRILGCWRFWPPEISLEQGLVK